MTQLTTHAETSTRDRLIESARRLFREHGYHATSIAEILRAADVRSGSLYYFFPTKEDLLLAVLESYKAIMWPALLKPIFDRVADPIERIFALLDGYRQMLVDTDFRMGCPIGNLSLELCDTLPSARKPLGEAFTAWSFAVASCLDRAADRLPADIDRMKLATFVLTSMEGAIMLARVHRTLDAYDAAIAHLRDYFNRLLHHQSASEG